MTCRGLTHLDASDIDAWPEHAGVLPSGRRRAPVS
jgi:hypothetical protein